MKQCGRAQCRRRRTENACIVRVQDSAVALQGPKRKQEAFSVAVCNCSAQARPKFKAKVISTSLNWLATARHPQSKKRSNSNDLTVRGERASEERALTKSKKDDSGLVILL